jgi:serine/threonine protein kinase
MGICGSKKDNTDDGSKHTSMHQAILRERKYDVYKKYEEIKVMGQGSMGHVAKVRVREGQEGGSAYPSSSNRGSKASQGRDNLLKETSSIASEKRKNRVDYALKSIKLDRVSPQFIDELKNEIDILKGMDHPNIVKAHEVYSYKKQIYIILELCDGGDLYTKLPYTEKQGAKIVGKLLSAIKYMHDHGIVHRDCK